MARAWTGIVVVALLVACLGGAEAALVGHWAFDEGLGQAAGDSSGNANNGVLGQSALVEATRDPSWVVGHLGAGALNFDGDSDLVTVPDSPSVSVTGDLAMSAWINVASTVGQRNIIAKDGNSAYRWRLEMVANRLWLLLSDGGLQVLDSGYSVPAGDVGSWHHTAVRYDSSALMVHFYYDGVLRASMPTTKASIADTAGALRLGAYDNNGGESFNGMLDDLAIWNETLSDGKAIALYGLGMSALGYTAGEASQLFAVFDAGNGAVTTGGQTWVHASGLAGAEGDVLDYGHSLYAVILDGAGNGLVSTPEPGTLSLLVLGGLAGLARRRRRRRRA